jgi:uncharacterized protein (TIGR00297 family)
VVSYLIPGALLVAGGAASYFFKKLTLPAAVAGVGMGLILYLGSGWCGLALMALFFFLGTIATSWKRQIKESIHMAEADQGRRKISQVLANAGMAALAALYAQIVPQYAFLAVLLVAASFSSATADTLSSELGSVYGKRFYNMRTFRPDQRGLDGVISFEGTALGIVGSCLIALLYGLFSGWVVSSLLIIIVAGTIGNLSDSLLGATLERKGVLKNDAVNFLNTAIAELTAFILYRFL